MQAPLPLQAPPQPPKVEPPVGVAVSVTVLPLTKPALQIAPQLIPAGLLVTVPLPVLLTLRSTLGTAVNCAVTVWFPFITTTQAPVPLQAPPQPAKVDPPDAVARSVTELPAGKLAEQPPPQLMPLGLLLTVPLPDFVTDRLAVFTPVVNIATTVALLCNAQTPVPEQPAPLHPAKADPGDAAADKTTDVPASNCAEHTPPQARPAGDDVTVPLPVPCFWTVIVTVRASLISTLTGTPGCKSTPLVLPEYIFCPAALNALTAMVLSDPTGAWMLTGINCPLDGSLTGTVAVRGLDSPGAVIVTSMDAISETTCAHAWPTPSTHCSMNARTMEGGDSRRASCESRTSARLT